MDRFQHDRTFVAANPSLLVCHHWSVIVIGLLRPIVYALWEGLLVIMPTLLCGLSSAGLAQTAWMIRCVELMQHINNEVWALRRVATLVPPEHQHLLPHLVAFGTREGWRLLRCQRTHRRVDTEYSCEWLSLETRQCCMVSGEVRCAAVTTGKRALIWACVLNGKPGHLNESDSISDATNMTLVILTSNVILPRGGTHSLETALSW